MIHSGIEVGLFFETSMAPRTKDCQNMLATGRPFLQIIFVFVQMYFIFLNQKVDDQFDALYYHRFLIAQFFQMNVYKNKFTSRFGLMHMIATNLCVWINVLIMETKHEVLHYQDMHKSDDQEPMYTNTTHDSDMFDHNDTITDHHHGGAAEELPQAEHLVSHVLQACHNQRNVMGQLLSNSAPFLFPCTIEYSLICAAVLYTMWKNIEDEHDHYQRSISNSRKESAGLQLALPSENT